jgi:hypothetical protein
MTKKTTTINVKWKFWKHSRVIISYYKTLITPIIKFYKKIIGKLIRARISCSWNNQLIIIVEFASIVNLIEIIAINYHKLRLKYC